MPPRARVRGTSYRTAMGTRVIDKRRQSRWGYRTLARARPGYRTVARTRGWAAEPNEIKYFDTTKAATALVASVDWTGTEFDPATFNTLCVPKKGTNINERIGRKISVMKIKIRGMIVCAAQANQTATDAATVIRLALVQDMQTNATQMQGEQVFKAPSTAAAPNAVVTWRSLDTFGRFNILKEKFFTIQNPNLSWDGTNMEQNGIVRTFKLSHNFKKPVDVNFNAADGDTVADIVDNSFHVICNASAITLTPLILYEARVSYKG